MPYYLKKFVEPALLDHIHLNKMKSYVMMLKESLQAIYWGLMCNSS